MAEASKTYMCFYSTSYIFTLYRPQIDEIVMFGKLTETIDSILSEYLSVRIPIFGDFNTHRKEW